MDDKEETSQTVYITYNYNDLAVASFISYLVPALYNQGIDAVYDKTGHKLESIRFSDIKLFLVVFSNSYAFSVPCLEKLVKLLEFLPKEGHMVVPVFYDAIDKQQIDIFGEAFGMLEKSYSTDQVTKWRCLLEETMELQGHEYTDELSEQSEFIEEIARAVSEKLRPTENIGIHRVLPELDILLCKQAWGFRSIGIFGVPGIGKTVLAKAAFRRLSGGYDVSHFIIVACKEKRVELFSTEDFKDVSMEKFGRNNQDSEPCYRRKRVLLVLDDVRNTQEVKSFLCEFGRFGPGSLLIITSRDIKVLQECRINEIYELKGLNNEDSLKLFRTCFYGEDLVNEKLPEYCVREIERFDGNPSSIRLYAEEMKNKKTKDKKETTLSRSWHNPFICYKNIPLSCFQETTYNFHERLNLSLLSCVSRVLNIDLNPEQHNNMFYIKDPSGLIFSGPALESLPTDVRIPHFGHESLVPYQLHKPPLFMGFEDYSRLVTDQLDPIQVINLGGCIEVKHFPEFLRTMRELNVEGLQWRLQTHTLCPLCSSANSTKSYFYFEFTLSCSNGTTISNRIHISPLRMLEDVVSALVNLTGKAKKILSRTTWHLNIYSIYSQGFIKILPKFMPHRT